MGTFYCWFQNDKDKKNSENKSEKKDEKEQPYNLRSMAQGKESQVCKMNYFWNWLPSHPVFRKLVCIYNKVYRYTGIRLRISAVISFFLLNYFLSLKKIKLISWINWDISNKQTYLYLIVLYSGKNLDIWLSSFGKFSCKPMLNLNFVEHMN